MEITRLRPNGIWDSTPYNFSQAVRIRGCQDLLFIAGQAGIDGNGQVVDGLEPQIRVAFDNIRHVVEDAGGTMANVIRITGYLRDMNA
ncbi:MAG: RidA family protein, partial [Acidobacteria bacterium]|nr:RidA family protein [Acidobacteriota bacterium]